MNGSAEGPGEWGPSVAAVSALVDRVAASFSAGAYAAEIRAAREAFDRRRGKVFDDDETYAQHMARFLEWYALERRLDGGQVAPVVELLRRGELESQRELALALARSHTSLFEVLAWGPGFLRIYDLVGSSFWRVRMRAPAVGLEAGEIAEARVIPWRHEVALGPVVIFHPRAAREPIHRIVQARNAAGTIDSMLVSDLAEMRLRFARYRNMAIEHIYKDRPPNGAGARVGEAAADRPGASRREGV